MNCRGAARCFGAQKKTWCRLLSDASYILVVEVRGDTAQLARSIWTARAEREGPVRRFSYRVLADMSTDRPVHDFLLDVPPSRLKSEKNWLTLTMTLTNPSTDTLIKFLCLSIVIATGTVRGRGSPEGGTSGSWQRTLRASGTARGTGLPFTLAMHTLHASYVR